MFKPFLKVKLGFERYLIQKRWNKTLKKNIREIYNKAKEVQKKMLETNKVRDEKGEIKYKAQIEIIEWLIGEKIG